MQERRLKCKQCPKRSTTAAEIEAVHQEIEVLQAETDQAVQEYEVSGQCCAQTCLATSRAPENNTLCFNRGSQLYSVTGIAQGIILCKGVACKCLCLEC